MENKSLSSVIYNPSSIAEAFDILDEEENSGFWAGGTTFTHSDNSSEYLYLPKVVISLRGISELEKLSKNETYVDIGSTMTLDRLSMVGKNKLPASLHTALLKIGTKALRSRATLGGHLAMKDRIGDLMPVLMLHEARIEIKYLRERSGFKKPVISTKKIPVAGLLENNGLLKGELISQISIPLNSWNVSEYRKIFPDAAGRRTLIFSAVARVEKEILSEWRLAVSDGNKVYREREMELAFNGHTLPLNTKELQILKNFTNKLTEGFKYEYEKETIFRLIRRFLFKAAYSS